MQSAHRGPTPRGSTWFHAALSTRNDRGPFPAAHLAPGYPPPNSGCANGSRANPALPRHTGPWQPVAERRSSWPDRQTPSDLGESSPRRLERERIQACAAVHPTADRDPRASAWPHPRRDTDAPPVFRVWPNGSLTARRPRSAPPAAHACNSGSCPDRSRHPP